MQADPPPSRAGSLPQGLVVGVEGVFIRGLGGSEPARDGDGTFNVNAS
ncbi:protein of unknown function [Pseudomonas mediterranea]